MNIVKTVLSKTKINAVTIGSYPLTIANINKTTVITEITIDNNDLIPDFLPIISIPITKNINKKQVHPIR